MFHKFLLDVALFYITYVKSDAITALEKNFPPRICDIRLTENDSELLSLQTKILDQIKDLSLLKSQICCEYCLIHFKENESENQLNIKNILDDIFSYLEMIFLDQMVKDVHNPVGFYEDYNDTLNKLRNSVVNLEQAENSITAWKEALPERAFGKCHTSFTVFIH